MKAASFIVAAALLLGLSADEANASLLDEYFESPNNKLYVSCPHRAFAVWNQEDVYEAYRAVAIDIGGDYGYRIPADCKILYINNASFTLGNVSWVDPTALYRSTTGAKSLVSCEYGFKAFAKSFESQRHADEMAMAKAEKQGLTNCEYLKDAQGLSRNNSHVAGAKTEVYEIDLLKIKHTYREAPSCATGLVNEYELSGVIGPDSTFAMSRLFERNPACSDASGQVVVPTVISLNSNGGLLNDGFALGRELRRLGISAVVGANKQCASSCAVAFLGGLRRAIHREAMVMFHAPYFTGENALGKRDINCDVGEEALSELNAYYQEMTDVETGNRLFERTMWYCSADDGWVVKGGSAAELYGIATEK